MSLVDNGNANGMVMPVAPMNGGGYYGGSGFMGGDWSFWIIILFLFAFMGNGFGNNGYGGAPAMIGNDVQRGFDQSAVMSSLNNIGTTIGTGFAAAEANAANRQMANMQQLYGFQSVIDNRLDTIAMAQQNCCCENRAAIADVKYTIANEAAATRTSASNDTQKLMDKLCQLEMDGIKQNYENRISGMQNTIDSLRSQINEQSRIASQNAQTAQILADNAAQTTMLEQYLAPTPRPAWIVQNPNCCGTNWNGCGCAA